MLDVLHSLLQLTEGSHSAIEQRAPALRWLDTVRATVQELRTDAMFERGNRPGNGGLSCVQHQCALAHAAGLHHGHQHVEVVKLDSTSYPIAHPHVVFSIALPLWGHREIALY